MKQSRPVQIAAAVVALACGLGLARLCHSLERLFPPRAVRVESEEEAETEQTEAPQRIISLSPGITESLFALGLGDRVVGVSQWSTHPPDVADLPRVGGFYNPNFEAIVALQPDMIVFQGQFDKLRTFADKWDIRYRSFRVSRVSYILETIEALGEMCDVPRRGELVSAGIRMRLLRIAAAVEGRPRPRVFIVIGRERGTLRQIMTVGGETFASDLVELAGGRNVFADLEEQYPTVSVEAIVERKPDVILELMTGQELSEERRAQVRSAWAALPVPAVPDRVHLLTQEFLLLPGPRITRTARVFAEAIHPEVKLPNTNER